MECREIICAAGVRRCGQRESQLASRATSGQGSRGWRAREKKRIRKSQAEQATERGGVEGDVEGRAPRAHIHRGRALVINCLMGQHKDAASFTAVTQNLRGITTEKLETRLD